MRPVQCGSIDLEKRIKGAQKWWLLLILLAFFGRMSVACANEITDFSQKINLQHSPILEPGTDHYLPWKPIDFFTMAAGHMLKDQLGVDLLQGIEIYPTNCYNSAVHRLLQLAANIYDATTNNIGNNPNYTNLPSVFRPVFRRTNDKVVIAGYVEETRTNFLTYRWVDLNSDSAVNGRNSLPDQTLAPITNVMAYGVPVIIGAKKGLPNFNEFAMQTAVQVIRRLEFIKKSPLSLPYQTNQLFEFSISNSFGLEAWNSYTQAYPRSLQVAVLVHCDIALTNLDNSLPVGIYAQDNPLHYDFQIFSTNIEANTWLGKQFRVPFNLSSIFLTNMAFSPSLNQFQSLSNASPFDLMLGYLVPNLQLSVDAKVRYWLIDTGVTPNRIIDFVNLDNLRSVLNISQPLIGYTNSLDQMGVEGSFWQTNLSKSGVPSGVRQQILVSFGEGTNSSSVWTTINAEPVDGNSKSKAIDLCRVFVGLQPIEGFPYYQLQKELGSNLVHWAPFSPARKIFQNITWQANDPLVHYLAADMTDSSRTNDLQFVVPVTKPATNSNLGALNKRYSPWGGNPYRSSDKFALDSRIKDPFINQSDDWLFPTDGLPNIGWLGRVHRGTPWQTIYMKSAILPMPDWAARSGHYVLVGPSYEYTDFSHLYTHPTNDWRLFDLFTTDSDSKAVTVSINDPNQSSWASVLSGLEIWTNTYAQWYRTHPTNLFAGTILPRSPELQLILDDITWTRAQQPNGVFEHMGDLLAVSSLSTNSPYTTYLQNQRPPMCSEEVLECIPMQLLPLLRGIPPASLLSIERSGPHAFVFRWKSLPHQSFRVQSSGDLKFWSVVKSPYFMSKDGECRMLINAADHGDEPRYFRVLSAQ